MFSGASSRVSRDGPKQEQTGNAKDALRIEKTVEEGPGRLRQTCPASQVPMQVLRTGRERQKTDVRASQNQKARAPLKTGELVSLIATSTNGKMPLGIWTAGERDERLIGN